MTEPKTEQLAELLSGSQVAFLNGVLQDAFRLAKEAIELDPDCADAYQCAANVCMSLNRFEDAIDYYQQAIRCEPSNGNRYFNLGYAQASANKLADAINSFARADELGLNEDAAGQMYHILGIANQQLGRLDDALINLKKSELVVPGDLDVMKRKAAIYGILDDVPSGLNVANQMKLLAPSDYAGYQVAYILLKQAGRLRDAFEELRHARKNLMDFPFALCEDMINYELVAFEKDREEDHLNSALLYIRHYLKKEKPTQYEVIQCYLAAADICLQLEKADDALDCLKAAEKPVFSYNHGVLYQQYDPVMLDESSILHEMNANLYRYEQLSVEQLQAMIAQDVYYTPDGKQEEAEQEYTLSDDEPDAMTPEDLDRLNRLFIGAYTLKDDYRKVMYYALELQKSREDSLVQLGWYTEAQAMKQLAMDGWQDKYEEVQKKLRNAVLQDSADLNAVMLRIRCLMDTGRYDEAEQKCSCLKKEIGGPLMEEIRQARNGGI